MKTGISSDHGGFELKEAIRQEFKTVDWVDFGVHTSEPADYPDKAAELCRAILSGKLDRGILICGTGIGISIAANRFRGIRAALCHDVFTAEMCRRHNDANVLALGGRVLEKDMAFRIVRLFLDTPFDGGRHGKRIEKIDSVTQS